LWGNSVTDVRAVANTATYGVSGLIDYSTTPDTAVNALWSSGPNAYVGVGERLEGGPIWTMGATQWTSAIAQAGAADTWNGNTDPVVVSPALTAAGEIWLIANGSTSQFTNGAYVPYASGTAQKLRVITVGPQGEVWAAGEQGSVTHLVGSAFQASTVGAPVTLEALWIDAVGTVWAGGGAGRVFSRTGTTWTDHSAPISSLRSLWGRSSTDVFAGGTGSVYRYYSGTWHDTAFPGFGEVLKIWGNASEVFAYDGRVWRLSAGAWQTVSPALGGPLAGDSAPFVQGNDVWAIRRHGVARQAQVAHWNGSLLREYLLPDNDIDMPSSIAVLPSGEAWVFGPSLAVRHYTP
jgi:hypothetical protein